MLDMHHHTMEREHAHDIVQVALWMSLLRACSGAEAFMKKHQGRVSAQALVSFLLYEQGFPRSLRYCLKSSRALLRTIWPTVEAGGTDRAPTARVDALVQWLDGQKPTIEGGDIHEILTHIVDETAAICMLVSTEIEGPPRQPRGAKQTQSQAQTQTQTQTT
jgi:uncharacterized alpha-E superfamily protein